MQRDRFGGQAVGLGRDTTRKVCSQLGHIPTKRPETCAKELIGAKPVERLKELGFTIQFQHTVQKFQHVQGFAVVAATQTETNSAVSAVIGDQGLAKLQAQSLCCIPFALYQSLKEEDYMLRSAARQTEQQ